MHRSRIVDISLSETERDDRKWLAAAGKAILSLSFSLSRAVLYQILIAR